MLNKSTAIKEHCLDCSGGNYHDVALCAMFDCPLWSWRIGSPVSIVYRQRMERLRVSQKKEIQRMKDDGIEVDKFFVYVELSKKGRRKKHD